MGECQIKRNFLTMLKAVYEWFILNPNRKASEDLTQMKRVDQQLCDEFENGRAHGEGIIYDSKYVINDGNSWLNLHKGYTLDFGRVYSGFPFDFHTGGDPSIEGYDQFNTVKPLNGTWDWETQFPYLRASVSNQVIFAHTDSLGITDAEYQQARALGNMWGLSGRWGDKNRLAEGNWHIDDSLLTTGADSSAAAFGICDEKNIPQYPIGLFPTDQGILLLSWVYLKRIGFFGARRFLCAPEQNIAVWGIETITQYIITDFILSYDPGMVVRYPDGIKTTAFGCIAGGISAVAKSNFSPLRGKRVWPVLINAFDRDEVDFVIKSAAELRKKQIDFCCVQIMGDRFSTYYDLQGKRFWGTELTNWQATELSIPDLRELARKHNISIPEELCSDYLGDITELVNIREDVPVVQGLFNLGEVVVLNIRDREITPILTGHFANAFSAGTDIFPTLWENGKFMTSVFVNDVADENAKYLRKSGVRICDTRFIEAKPEERLNDFRAVIGDSKVVIFAASGLWKYPELFRETLRWCRSHNISAVILSNPDDSNCLKYTYGKSITVDRIDGNTGITVAVNAEGVAAVEACFNSNGQLLSVKELSCAKNDQISMDKTIPSAPYDNSLLNEVKALPPEKKLAALATTNNGRTI